jgi:hypothetical protein
VGLLPVLAARDLDRTDSEDMLVRYSGLASEAAACALAAGRPAAALELLEQARAVLWSQVLDTRTDLTVLSQVHPHLATELTAVLAGLDGPADQARAANRRLPEVLAEIRTQPGFDTFFLPRPAEQLYSAAARGPVVVVNIARQRCDALVVTMTGVRVIPLSAVTRDEAYAQADGFLAALKDFPDGTGRALQHTLEWLWDNVCGPVLEHLGYPAAPDDGDVPWPRVWWCATGPLVQLPLHAAGYHDGTGRGQSVLDRVVSSYTPTLRALIEAREAEPAMATPAAGRLLAVAMPTTPGEEPLPGVDKEITRIQAHVDGQALTILCGAEATRAAAVSALATHSLAHLACHGAPPDLIRPSATGLVLHDGILSVARIAEARHGHGEFAFLSACHSHTAGDRGVDEVITLAAAFHYTGWRHVIATLWWVKDRVSVTVADHLYAGLSGQDHLQPRQAAQALHAAVRRLRANWPDHPAVWASFVHIGP